MALMDRLGGLADEAARLRGSVDSEDLRVLGKEVLGFVPDVVRMLRGVVGDDRVPHKAKIEAGAAIAYLLSPFDRVTDLIPVVGQLDDVAVIAFAVRRLVAGAGEPVLREYWTGSDRAFRALMSLTTALATPAGLLRRTAVLGGLIGVLRGVRRHGDGYVVDGEVVDRHSTPPR